MVSARIKAVTFDLWDTVILDDSDEPKRAAQGLLPKAEERRRLVHEFLGRHEPVSPEAVDVAYRTTDAAFRSVWYGQNVTWTVHERLSVLLRGLGRELPEEELTELVRLHEEMELTVPPELVPGAAEALQAVHARYRLGVISDTIFSPGRALKQLLAEHDILRFFDFLVFSDEQGCCKPDPRMFHAAAQGLGVDVTELVHVGDREQKDVDGPLGVGARSVLSKVVVDRGASQSRAAAICDDYARLPAILESLDS